MQPLIQYLQRSGQFTEQQIEQIRSRLIFRTLQKGERFSEPGHPSNEIAFIIKGILRVFSPAPAAQEITRYFMDENHFAMAGNEYTEAIMRSELAILSAKALQNQSFTTSDWDRLRDHIAASVLAEKEEQISPTLAGDATSRYRKFMEKYPQIAGRVPLSYLASYLGITQQSLSRIRKQLTKRVLPARTDNPSYCPTPL